MLILDSNTPGLYFMLNIHTTNDAARFHRKIGKTKMTISVNFVKWDTETKIFWKTPFKLWSVQSECKILITLYVNALPTLALFHYGCCLTLSKCTLRLVRRYALVRLQNVYNFLSIKRKYIAHKYIRISTG